MKNNKGFTLVELLAVIVILAIIMIIAIPAVLETMQTAKRKTFKEYAMKVSSEAQKVYLGDQLTMNPGSCVLYNIKTDLNLNNSGDYKGYVVVKNLTDKQKVYVTLFDDEYMIYGVEQSYLEKAELQRYSPGENLSEKNILSVAGCSDYTVKATSGYESKTETLITPQSSMPEVKKLLTGEKEGNEGWIGVYDNGNIVGCYNKEGNYDVNFNSLNDGSLETSYCVGLGFYSTKSSECEAHKTVSCCTASATETPANNKVYYYFLTKNNNATSDQKSCGFLLYDNGGKLFPSTIGTFHGGGLPESGVYEE